jgi:hypothetical protein
MADKLTAFMCRLSRNLGASNSWNTKGLSRPVMGLLYLKCKLPTLLVAETFILLKKIRGKVSRCELEKFSKVIT